MPKIEDLLELIGRAEGLFIFYVNNHKQEYSNEHRKRVEKITKKSAKEWLEECNKYFKQEK